MPSVIYQNQSLVVTTVAMTLLTLILFVALISRSHSSPHALSLPPLEANFYSPQGITHDTVLRHAHSHNDYWRSPPLLDALSHGIRSVEADVWLGSDGKKVFVGHSPQALSKENTLATLYVQPIMDILGGANNLHRDTPRVGEELNVPVGVFATDPHATLFLFIDLKQKGNALYDAVWKELQPLRDHGWLSYWHFDNKKMHWGPITVIGTGETPLERVVAGENGLRDLFFDGDLSGSGDYSVDVSPVASGALSKLVGRRVEGAKLTADEVSIVCGKLKEVHDIGGWTRVWDTPGWPIAVRNEIWEQIWSCGGKVLINADDLDAISKW